ncbi:MAG: regulatory iron-sulfur-containing complex subunit RicT [Gemmatimonadota bacterium]|nr:regulatory iron-sulfur-containing complex subunit RicT [Gemmatimonadota bacterium]MDH4350335.1 regulatory iron-sulfur-containing complex subunit RicT [Gemmatimonadota bacterium]MDH5197109.1 regulatory iron-sulfur-containing complex subunit RicT [Gemmatimonadota bacterium]
MPELVEVRFKGNRKDYFTWDQPDPLAPGLPVIVAVDRGEDFGTVSAFGEAAARKCGVGCSGCSLGAALEPRGTVTRAATTEDTHLANELRKAEDDIRRTVIQRATAHRLAMKISDAEWQWDRRKLTVYFTAEQRVDFRTLVRDLASLFRTRIELRQIGARDEAKRLQGVGRCGREYCCSSWLPELRPVSLALAKDQHLSLNPSQISGGCGRLLCCLRYEHEFYVGSRKRFPKEGKILATARGQEKVQAVDIFRERVLLRSPDGTARTVTLAELRDELAAGSITAPPAPAEPTPPAQLATFDEGSSTVSPERTLDAVAPSPKRGKRRRRRGRRGGRGRPAAEQAGDDAPPPPETDGHGE